ncbi:MAG: hypothetical protein AB8B64_17820 [Granulosicoccus sp.]
MAANPSNPDGHFEDCDIVALHKDMLAANQREWFSLGTDLSSKVQGFTGRARTLVARFPADQHMGFKDPRSCLFLPWWHGLLDRPASVFVFRHYTACYHSLRNRQAQNLSFDPSRHKDNLFFWQQPEIALELWIDYNQAIINYVKSQRDTALLVSHHSLLNGFNLPAALNRLLGINLDMRCQSGIRPGNRVLPGIEEKISDNLQIRLNTTLEALNELCCSRHEPNANSAVYLEADTPTVNTAIKRQIEIIEKHCDRLTIPPLDDTTHSAIKATMVSEKVQTTTVTDIGHADDSNDVKQLIQWGKQHQSMQNHDAAEACWLKAHHLAPRNFSTLLQLGLQARNLGQHRKAAVLMMAAITLKPDNAGFYVHLARALKQTDRLCQALSTVKHGLTLQNNHLELQLLQVELLRSTGDPVAAREACSKALSLFPDNYKLVRFMVKLMSEAGDSSTAMEWFRHSVVVRIRQQKNYRQTLYGALENLPPHHQLLLSRQVVLELASLHSA